MRRWIAALAAEQIGNNQTLFQDPALWYQLSNRYFLYLLTLFCHWAAPPFVGTEFALQ